MRVMHFLLRNRSAAPVADLTEDLSILLSLLNEPDAWRIRSVEGLNIGSAQLCVQRRTLQVAPLNGVIGFPKDAQSVRLLLPVDSAPKRPLLGFDIKVDEKPAYLLPRVVVAGLQAEHVVALSRAEGVDIESSARELIEAMCAFTPSIWERYRRFGTTRSNALSRYLRDGLGDALAISRSGDPTGVGKVSDVRALLDGLLREGELIGQVLRRLGTPHDPDSSAENPLLALPVLAEKIRVLDGRELLAAVTALRHGVERLGSRPQGSQALRTLAAYGVRWPVIADCEVPTSRPFLVRMQHETPLKVGRWTRRGVLPVSIGDARSNHVIVSSSDPDVEIAKVGLRGEDGRRIQRTLVAGIRSSRDRFAFYLADPGRDLLGTLSVRLRVPLAVKAGSIVVGAVSLMALAVLASSLVLGGTVSVASLAVLTLPTTFAASLLLTRERTSLSRRLQWIGRSVAGVSTLGLWALVTVSWLNGLVST